MRRWRRRIIRVALVLFIVWGIRLRRVHVPSWPHATTPAIAGAFHVHTVDSHDSRTKLSAYLSAAKALGHAFVVVTDHDAPVWPPLTLNGMVVLRESELSSTTGHLIALRHPPLPTLTDADAKLADAKTFGLAQPRDLTAELRDPAHLTDFGLWPVVAHPDDLKRPWTGPWPKRGGIEVINAAAALRQVAQPFGFGIVPLGFAWLVRRDAALWPLWRYERHTLRRLDQPENQNLVGYCGVDAHGWLPLADNLSIWTLQWAPTHSQGLQAQDVTAAMNQGAFNCVAGLKGGIPNADILRFTAQRPTGTSASPSQTWTIGQTIVADDADKQGLDLKAELAVTDEAFRLVLLHNAEPIAYGSASLLQAHVEKQGSYRIEVQANLPNLFWGRRWAPVILSGRIAYVGRAPA